MMLKLEFDKAVEPGALDGFELHVCENCAAFGQQIDHGQSIECEADGACRMNPPMVMAVDDAGGFSTIFPPVNREDWCLSWTRKGAMR